MPELTDLEKHQHIYVLLNAKFLSEKSFEIRHFEVVNKIIKTYLDEGFEDKSIQDYYDNFGQRPMYSEFKIIKDIADGFVFERNRDSSYLQSSDDLRSALIDHCFPHTISNSVLEETITYIEKS
ncbi:hypothetical protein [Parasedimentitalea maritima]|uniref:Uncharacterized protein n=1 Tax=Parasedimentitalea maritima TaxID=2578117 RepID=A0A6A4REL5_9RHOB|nr:hypothetical protein [Zongyanglinia marina]KAE9627659.1 hypothetical protein GP644_18955 [Zongyanglinia marina]